MDKLSITLAPKSLYLKSLRLFTASLASDIGFDIEAVEDLRVVVSEAVNYKLTDTDVVINYTVEEKALTIEVVGKDKDLDERALKMRDLILQELADEVNIGEDSITITKRA